jgi:hypothetical protein
MPRQAADTQKGMQVGTAFFPRDSKDLWEVMDIADDRATKNGA